MNDSLSLVGAAYIRVSTEDQLEYSPDSQLKKIQEYAAAHKIRLLREHIYIDEGISGRSVRNRPAFQKMILQARKKPRPFDRILVWKFSRFARNRQDSIMYKSMLRKECGIDVISVTEQLSDDPTSILIEALLEAMDEYYSINLAQEVQRGMNEKFLRGGVVSIPPFGYRMEGAHYAVDPLTAPALQMIFSEYLEGKTLREISEHLNQKHIQTRRDHPFQPRTVKYILSNPFYAGFQRRTIDAPPSGRTMHIVRGSHEALICEEDFLEVQQRLRHTVDLSPGNRPIPADFMLKGLVRCSCCGATLTLSRRTNTLQCCRYARGRCSQSHSISLSILNRAFYRKLAQDLLYNKKDRKSIPVLDLLLDKSLSQTLKNRILRSFISHITFYRSENCIQIHYRIPS